MNYIRIIPSILIMDKKCAKGKKFKDHINVGSPVTTAISFDSQKADEILVLDIEAFQKKTKPDFNILREMSKNISTPITFGGNLRTMDDIKKSFDNGADKVYLNSVLFENSSLVEKISKIYGSQSIMGGVNLIKKNKDYKIYLQSKYIDPIRYLKKLQDLGVGEIKVTFVDSEGTRSQIDENYCIEIFNNIDIPCIFGGGIANLNQIKSLISKGIQSISLGSILNFSDYNIIKVKKFLINENFKVSLEF